MWFGKLPTSTGESPYYLEIEKGYNKYMEEDHSTPFHTLCCIWQHGSSSSFSLLLVTSLSHTLLHMAAGLLPMAAWQQLLFLSSSRHFTLTHSAAYGSRAAAHGSMAAAPLSLFFSSLHSHTLSHCTLKYKPSL